MYDLYRIIEGVIRTKHLVVKAPSLRTLVDADRIHKEAFEKAYSEKIMTRRQLKEMIIDSGILPANYEDQIRILRNKIEDFKVRYYEDFAIPTQKKVNFKNIEDMEFSITCILTEFSKFSQLTCESIADTAKNLHILTTSTFNLKDNPYDWEHVTISQLQNYIYTITLDEKQIREMALCPEWRSMWSIRDVCSVFDKQAHELTAEQKELVTWSKFYDSIFESQETPSDEIIRDPYAIDGWIIYNRRENEAEKDEIQAGNKHGNAQEVFKMSRSNEDARAIRNMNSSKSKELQDRRFQNLE